MSGVARYYTEKVSSHPQGAFVRYEDYAALLERIAALEGALESARNRHVNAGRGYVCVRCHFGYDVEPGESEDCPACGCTDEEARALDAARVGG